jgi:hypothetical protein
MLLRTLPDNKIMLDLYFDGFIWICGAFYDTT